RASGGGRRVAGVRWRGSGGGGEGGQRGGEVALVDDREAVGGAGDGHIECVAAVGRLGDDAGRVGQHHPVELQALGLRDGQQGGGRVEGFRALAGDRLRDRRRDLGDGAVGGDDRQPAAVGAAQLGQVRAGGPGDLGREVRTGGDG